MNHSELLNELGGALAKAQGQIQAAKKDSANPFFKSKYADLASVWDACRKPLSDNGLSVSQFPCEAENGVAIETMLIHSSGQWISSRYTMPVSKNDAQAVGSAITYARRYALAAVVGIAPEDDDGNAAAKANPEKKEKSASTPYPEIKWSKNSAKWQGLVSEGKKTAQNLIDYISSIGTISDDRKALIRSWEKQEEDIKQ